MTLSEILAALSKDIKGDYFDIKHYKVTIYLLKGSYSLCSKDVKGDDSDIKHYKVTSQRNCVTFFYGLDSSLCLLFSIRST